MNLVFISDFFVDEISGGGEINDQAIIDELISRGHKVSKYKSCRINKQIIDDNKKSKFIISNFIQLDEVAKEYIQKECSYIIYEHDHKYLRNRNPALYQDFLAPDNHIINKKFYSNALAVFCQSSFHCNILRKNLVIDNIKNVAGNAWSEESLEVMRKLCSNEKKDVFSIMDSNISHKNTSGAVNYCKHKEQDYELIKDNVYHSFLEKLSKNKKIAFFPKTPETLSRVLVEARMMNIEVHTNSNIGATHEDWFSLKGEKLIQFMSKKRRDISIALEQVFETERCSFFIEPNNKKVSIITSLYNGDDHIESFLEQIISQTYFDNCELIIVDANSPGNEYQIISKYMEKYENIFYERLDKDPGIYGCWNIGIQKSTGEYITNANLDDRRSLQQIEIFVNELEKDKSIDLAYSECYITNNSNETYSKNTSNKKVYPVSEFSLENMIKCLPGCMPVWRRELHDKCGFFDESYRFAGDWEMWLRFASKGHKFKKIEGTYGLYYFNPKGLSTDASRQKQKFDEEKKVFWKYEKHLSKSEQFDWHKEYFK